MHLFRARASLVVPMTLALLSTATGHQARAQEPAAETKRTVEKNPFTGDEAAAAEGKKLYFKWNCYGCHGSMGGGGMGPSLIDTDWRYGAEDPAVFQSIEAGRPQGMPLWADKLTEEEIWQIVAYVRTLYKGDPAKIVW